MSEACSVCGVDPTTRSGWAAVASRTQVIDGKRYCYACVPVDDDERRRRLADHGISLAQLRAGLDAALKRIEAMDLVIKEQYRAIGLLNERVHLLERDMFDVHPNALSAGKA